MSFAFPSAGMDQKPESADASYTAWTQERLKFKLWKKLLLWQGLCPELLIEVNKRVAQSGRVGQGFETVERAGLEGGKRFEA